ncbi:Chromatin protein family [Theobroma cacao]|uniref:Chromatin protein family n=1 Tax=Theobroma cacao TaxID=3641 RepID=A0A061EKD7_THECC|nr:Chromatin protein family [Theobroma cacao]
MEEVYRRDNEGKCRLFNAMKEALVDLALVSKEDTQYPCISFFSPFGEDWCSLPLESPIWGSLREHRCSSFLPLKAKFQLQKWKPPVGFLIKIVFLTHRQQQKSRSCRSAMVALKDLSPDAIVKDLISKILRNEEEGDDEERQKEIEETMQETKAVLEKIVNVRVSAAQPKNVTKQSSDSKYKYIKYKPSQRSDAFNSGDKARIIRMVGMSVDPLERPKFKRKRVPKASGSPPVPVMHSPPRPVTVKDHQDWKIPPCISNRMNPKGYSIPLDKHLAADERGLQEVQINDTFAKLSKALNVAVQKAREEVAMRSKLLEEMMVKERKKQELRALAAKARSERTGTVAPSAAVPMSSDRKATDTDMRVDYEPVREREREMPKESKEEREKRLQREKIREERRRERERERRLEAKDAAMGKKSTITRDRDREISEKVDLGMASTGAGRGGEVMYDQRLFNQEKGMDSVFATDNQYNIYDKGLFTEQPTLSTLYRPKKDMDSDMYGGADEQLEKMLKTDRFKPDKAFGGTSERIGPRDRAVEFEKEAEEADPFGLDQFSTDVKKGKKAMEKLGTGATMKASAGSSMR